MAKGSHSTYGGWEDRHCYHCGRTLTLKDAAMSSLLANGANLHLCNDHIGHYSEAYADMGPAESRPCRPHPPRPARHRMIAALYVDPNGVYASLHDVDLWDETRDARTYTGPWPVVAHPPCARWSRLAGFTEAGSAQTRRRRRLLPCRARRRPHLRRRARASRLLSKAWDTYGLTEPIWHGGWTLGARRRRILLHRAGPLRATRQESNLALRLRGRATRAPLGPHTRR